MSSEHTLSARARKKIQAERERSEKERQIKMFNKRMDLARTGIVYYKSGKFKEALENYFQYLTILEHAKGVKVGGLEPKLFDPKRDAAELLLLSGIYWDMAKLQDKSRKKDTKENLKMYLDLFVKFSKGMPYQHMCAEMVRKYLMNEKANNKTLFKDTHLRLGGGKCFIATALEEECSPQTLVSLRDYRDQVLLKTKLGRLFVFIYYRLSPPIARLLLRLPARVRSFLAKRLDQSAIRLYSQ